MVSNVKRRGVKQQSIKKYIILTNTANVYNALFDTFHIRTTGQLKNPKKTKIICLLFNTKITTSADQQGLNFHAYMGQ